MCVCVYLYLNSRTGPQVFKFFAWSKMAEIRPKLLEIRSLLVGRPQTLELGSNERSLRSNFVQNCSKFQQNVVQLAQNVAKFVVLDFRSFSRLQCVRDSTCSAESRTLVFAGRRSTFKGSQTLPTDRKSTKIDKKLVQRCFMDRLRTKSRFFSLPGVAQQ